MIIVFSYGLREKTLSMKVSENSGKLIKALENVIIVKNLLSFSFDSGLTIFE